VTHHDYTTDAETSHDARNRAWRTFLQGLAIDVMVALWGLVASLAGGIEWNRAFWVALAVLAGKTVVQTVVSYLARHAFPPSG